MIYIQGKLDTRQKLPALPLVTDRNLLNQDVQTHQQVQHNQNVLQSWRQLFPTPLSTHLFVEQIDLVFQQLFVKHQVP